MSITDVLYLVSMKNKMRIVVFVFILSLGCFLLLSDLLCYYFCIISVGLLLLLVTLLGKSYLYLSL